MTNALCLACIAGAHNECFFPEIKGSLVYLRLEVDVIECCCQVDTRVAITGPDTMTTVVAGLTDPSKIQAGYKEHAEIGDPTSTGRKRAAQLKPIIEGMECEWARLAFAGGGATPIVGCRGNTLTREKGNELLTGNIHHGPDKSTLNNSDNNLHRICGRCHSHWHELNDKLYPHARPEQGAPFIPVSGILLGHDKHTLANSSQLEKDDQYWQLPKLVRPDYRSWIKGEF